MFKALQRAPPWTAPGHVCLTCRLQSKLVGAGQPFRRAQTTLAEPTRIEDGPTLSPQTKQDRPQPDEPLTTLRQDSTPIDARGVSARHNNTSDIIRRLSLATTEDTPSTGLEREADGEGLEIATPRHEQNTDQEVRIPKGEESTYQVSNLERQKEDALSNEKDARSLLDAIGDLCTDNGQRKGGDAGALVNAIKELCTHEIGDQSLTEEQTFSIKNLRRRARRARQKNRRLLLLAENSIVPAKTKPMSAAPGSSDVVSEAQMHHTTDLAQAPHTEKGLPSPIPSAQASLGKSRHAKRSASALSKVTSEPGHDAAVAVEAAVPFSQASFGTSVNVRKIMGDSTLQESYTRSLTEAAVPFNQANFGTSVNVRKVMNESPSQESETRSRTKDERPLTQDTISSKGFGLSKIQRELNSSAPDTDLVSSLRQRFFLPGRGEVTPFHETVVVRPKFADLKRKESPATDDNAQAAKNKTSKKSATLQIGESFAIDAQDLVIEPLDIEQPPVPKLSFGLDRALFNPGVVQLQDPHSGVYNFDPYLENIMPVKEFDYTALKKYQTSSEDQTLSKLARAHGKKYIGSTSSMTSSLSHFHYLLSHFREINTGMLSRNFHVESSQFTVINRAPSSIFLRWQNGTYAIDADKEWDSPNVLMMLGKSMEKLLTMPKEEFERYRKGNSHEIPDEERNAPEAYQYTTMGDMLMRSQLDAYDERLPGNGTFDLKTRAVVPIRMDATHFEDMLGYELITLQGDYESFEREYFDMLRSTMLKYMLQARMGRMDGIYMAYHNIERLFGFQYLPMYEIDRAMHGQIDPCLGDQEFKLSLRMFNEVLNAATEKFPEQSLRIMFETEGAADSDLVVMRVFAEPMAESAIDELQSTSKDRITKYEEDMMGIVREELNHKADAGEIETETETGPSTTSEARSVREASSMEQAESDTASSDVTDSGQSPNIVEAVDGPMTLDANYTPSIDAKDAVISEDDKAVGNTAPLFSALILVESRINNKIVVRPQNLLPNEKWTVKYSMIKFDDSRLSEAWAFYAQAKARRMKSLAKPEDNEEEPTKFRSAYLKKLADLAVKGRKYRARIDEANAGKSPVVWTSST